MQSQELSGALRIKQRVSVLRIEIRKLLTPFVRTLVRRTRRTRARDLLRGGGRKGRSKGRRDQTRGALRAASCHPKEIKSV